MLDVVGVRDYSRGMAIVDLKNLTVVHHGRHNPEERMGGVETFALGLRAFFGRVEFTWSGSPGIQAAVRANRIVICDNQTLLDYPKGYPLIGFRHGVAAVKARFTRATTDLKLAAGQLRAARRPGVAWVSCAQWIDAESRRLYRSSAGHVIYHPVDLERFDGRLDNRDSRLLLHDARTDHKGRKLIAQLSQAFPEFRFEGLDCPREAVPDRMRKAAAFLHLSRYEGNSIVCNEAMAMDLPCFFTAVGLMRDEGQNLDVHRVDPVRAFKDRAYLAYELRTFLDTLSTRSWNPRRWVEQHATAEVARRGWEQVVETLLLHRATA